MDYLLLCLMLFMPVGNEEAADRSPSLAQFLQDMENLSVPITVASRSEEELGKAPSMVTVFTRSEIQAMGVRTLEELLNYVPGYQVFSEIENGLQGFISARHSRSALSNTVLVLLDGVRLNNSHTGEATLLTRLISMDQVRQVEIIRGPGSALYGANAFLGVVNIVSEKELSEANIGIGSNENREATLLYSGESGRWNFSAYGRFFSDEGQSFDGLVDAGSFRPSDFSASSSDPKEGMDFRLALEYEGLNISFNFQERNFEDFYQFRLIGNGVNVDETRYASLKVSYDFDLPLGNELNAYVMSSQWDWDALGFQAPSGYGSFQNGDSIGGPLLENFNRALGLDYQYEVNDKNQLSLGVSYRETGNDTSRAQFNYDPLQGNRYLGGVEVLWDFNNESFTREVISIYLQDRHAFSDSLNLTLGVRHDDYNDFGSTTNPRGALVYSTPIDSEIKIMYGEAFRAPSLSELFNFSPITVGNPELGAEKIRTFEAAYYQYFDFFFGSLGYFRNEFNDLIVAAPQSAEEVTFTFRNLGETTTEGLELEFQFKLMPELSVRGGFSHALDGNDPMAPKDFGSIILNYDSEKWDANLNAIYRGEVDTLPDQSAYTLLNARLQYQLSDRISLFGTAKNLSDEDYQVSVISLTDLQRGVPERGREFLFGATIKQPIGD